MRTIAALVLNLSLVSHVFAGDFSLAIPVACDLGEDKRCFVQHFVDRDPGPNATDYQCGAITYDGHKGTDFALRSDAEIDAGVAVIAAASGTVTSIRDGMIDKRYDPATDSAQVSGRECGNGLVISHGDGWETQYCHLKRGSLAVRPGDAVASGTHLGLIGMSGEASFPHLHLSVRKDGTVVDPASPTQSETCGAPATDMLWSTPVPYHAGGLISVGFAGNLPRYDDIRAGTAHSQRLQQDSAALVLWGFAFGSKPGDVMRLRINDPDGRPVFNSDIEIKRQQAQYFRAGGRKTQNADWFIPGLYTGYVSVVRGGKVISDMTTQLDVSD